MTIFCRFAVEVDILEQLKGVTFLFGVWAASPAAVGTTNDEGGKRGQTCIFVMLMWGKQGKEITTAA